jgi:hypothetical protein
MSSARRVAHKFLFDHKERDLSIEQESGVLRAETEVEEFLLSYFLLPSMVRTRTTSLYTSRCLKRRDILAPAAVLTRDRKTR